MKNYAEQQMGAVLNPCVNHPEMNRAAEIPEDIMQAARKLAVDIRNAIDGCACDDCMIVAHEIALCAILAERQRAVDIVERYELIIAWQPASSSGSESFGRPFQSVLSKEILGADQ